MDDEPVFKSIPRIERFRRDLIKAKVPLTDSLGRKAVFHSSRHTLGTNLARSGVGRRTAMAFVRHNDSRLTDKVYIDESLLGTWGAVDKLPSYAAGASQIASQILGAEGQNVSLAVATDSGVKGRNYVENKGNRHVLTLPVTSSHLVENGGSGGARTRNLCRDRAAL